jgi:hypothetical protein
MKISVWRRYGWFFLWVLGWRGLFWLGAFPNPDEAYYWLWGQHLDWSYFDHPPFHGWVQGLFAAALGRSHWALRLPTLLTTLWLLLLYKDICHRLYAQQARHAFEITILLFLSSPLFFLFTAMAWQDHWLVAFGTTAGYCLIRYLAHDRPTAYKWLYGVGILVGLAGLCKYLALFLGLSFLIVLSANPKGRSLFRSPHLYGAIALACVILTPVFLWNIRHDFLSFKFYLGRSVTAESSSISWFGPIVFLLLSAVILGPVQSALLPYAVRFSIKNVFTTTYRQVAVGVLSVSTLMFALLSLKAPVLYYWNILAYPLMFPLLTNYFLPGNYRQPSYPQRVLDFAVSWGAIAACVLVFHYTMLPLSALVAKTGDEDTRMLYGWVEIADWVQTISTQFSSPPLLLTTDYRSAAALAYQMNDSSTLSLSGRIDQFDFWYDASQLDGQNAVLLGDRWHPICPTHLALFDRTTPPETLTIKRFNIPIKDYTLVRGYNLRANGKAADPFAADYPLAFTADGESCKAESPSQLPMP